MTERSPDRHRRGVDYSIAPVRRNVDRIRTDIRIEFSEQGMNWIVHYFDRRLNSDSVSRAFASKEDALRQACDLTRQNCGARFIEGPNDEKIDAVAITAWCKRRPTRKDPPPPKPQLPAPLLAALRSSRQSTPKS